MMKTSSSDKWIWAVLPAVVLAASVAGIFLMPAAQDNSDFNHIILIISALYIAYVLFAIIESTREDPFGESKGKAVSMMIALTITGLVLRILIGLTVPGYPADMSCWTAWSQAAAGRGLFSAYENTPFLDYPPGYLYILHILGTLGNILQIECLTPAYNLLLKIPAIMADLVMCWVIFFIGKKKGSMRLGVLLALLYSINPLIVLNSAAWGQIDSILTLAVTGYIILLHRKKIPAAALVFVAGLLLKPQMLFFGPVLAVVFIRHVIKEGPAAGAKTFFISLAGGAALFSAVVLPFAIGKEWTWIFSKYIGTISSYPYATLNAANIFGLMKLNWQPVETIILGIQIQTWGVMGLLFSVLIYFILSFIDRDEDNIFLLSSMLMTGLYTLGHKMHERYLFPVIALLLTGFLYTRKGTEFSVYGLLSVAIFINVAQVLAITHIPPDDLLYRASSLAVILAYIIMITACIIRATKRPGREEDSQVTDDAPALLQEPGQDS